MAHKIVNGIQVELTSEEVTAMEEQLKLLGKLEHMTELWLI
jgi:hypothetical protein